MASVSTTPARKSSRFYFSVPGHYGYGTEQHTFQAAVALAMQTVREIDGCPGEYTRAFVEARLEDEHGDRPLARVEVYADGTTSTLNPGVARGGAVV